MSSVPPVSVEMFSKEKSWFTVRTVVSDGDSLWVNGSYGLMRATKPGPLTEIHGSGPYTDWNADLLVSEGVLWACGGRGGVVRSTNEGLDFKPVTMAVPNAAMKRMAFAPDGVLWAGGATYEGEGLVLCGDPKGSSLARVAGAVGRVTAMAPSRLGVLIGDRDGRLWRGSGGKLHAMPLHAKEWIRTIYEAASGTLFVIAGHEDDQWEPTLYRSTDSGKSFVANKRKDPIHTLCELPGGLLVSAGWYGTIGVSQDDGQTFAKVTHKTSVADMNFTTSCIHRGSVVLGGPCQNIVSVAPSSRPSAASSTAKSSAPARTPKSPKPRSSTGYVGSGKFLGALEAVFGPLEKRAKVEKQPSSLDEQLDLLPSKLAAEMYALYMLHATYKLPRLCGLRKGGFCTIPSQYDMVADDLRESEWFVDQDDIDLVMSALEIYEDQGSPFILVGKGGVYAFYEDPYGYALIADSLTSFLQVLVALESAKKGKTSRGAAEKLLAAKIHEHAGNAKYADFILRTLTSSKEGNSERKTAPTATKVKKTSDAPPSRKAKASDGVRRFECTEGSASKFWEIARQPTSFTTRFGKIGTPGQTSTKVFQTSAEASAEHEKLVREKRKKGYLER